MHLENHKVAAKKLEEIKNRAFNFIKDNLGNVSEKKVEDFIFLEFKKQGLVSDYTNQIIAVNGNSGNPHYFPRKRSRIIRKNNLIKIDIWARLRKRNSFFADITWMGYTGKKIPKKIQDIFDKVIKARNLALGYIRKELKNKRLPKGNEVDRVVRDYFKKFKLDKYFIHGTGHSLGKRSCHGKSFSLAGKYSRKKLKFNIPFTIEPGIYFKNKFGVRSEIDCYITEGYKLVVTTKIQNKIVMI